VVRRRLRWFPVAVTASGSSIIGGTSIAAAYDATGRAWQAGPGRIYDELARVVVDLSPTSLAGELVLDVGAGTGAGSRAIASAGGEAIALDAAHGMLAFDRAHRPPATQGDASALPFADDSFAAVVAAFSLNHLDDPVAALREAARVTRRGGTLLASTYASDDTHPVKQAVELSLAEAGWSPADWYHELRQSRIPKLADAGRCRAAAAAAGIRALVTAVRVPFPDLTPSDLVEWRLGMAMHAPFFEQLSPQQRDEVRSRAIDALGSEPPPLLRSMLVIVANV
jgi:ubiquinone/menaquinone biosynthesis C-methylase UbiE